MAKKLNAAQYQFVCELLSGKTQESAYAAAYPKSRKWERNIRDINACKLLHTEHVWEYYQNRKKEIEDQAIEEAKKKGLWSRQKSLETLIFVVGLAVQDAKESKQRHDEDRTGKTRRIHPETAGIIMKGVQELNKMLDQEDAERSVGMSEPIVFVDDYHSGE